MYVRNILRHLSSVASLMFYEDKLKDRIVFRNRRSDKKAIGQKVMDGMFEQDITEDRTVKDNSEIEEARPLERAANNTGIGGRSAIRVLVSTLASRSRSVCKQQGSSDEMFKGF